MRHVYVIPTNRGCADAILDLSREVVGATMALGASIDMLVVDSSGRETAAANLAAIRAVASRTGASAYYVTAAELDDVLVRALQDGVRGFGRGELARFAGKDSYGIAINRALLACSALGADCVHRRDSDVKLQAVGTRVVSPLELELRYLGRPMREAVAATEPDRPQLAPGVHAQYAETDVVHMVGGSYVGHMPVDYEDLARFDMATMVRLVALPITGREAMSPADAKKHVERKFVQELAGVHASDEIRFPDQIASVGGNLSLYELFKVLPVSSAEKTSAVDYFHHGILRAVGWPYLHHNRSVVHEYTGERTDPDWMRAYYSGIAMGHCEAPYYNQLFSHVRRHRGQFVHDGKLDVRQLSEGLIASLSGEAASEGEAALRELIAAYGASNQDKFRAMASWIGDMGSQIIDKVRQDVLAHARLIECWGSLVEYVQTRELSARRSWRIE